MGRPLRTGKVKCVKCEVEYERTAENFPCRVKAKGWLSSWCKPCHKAHNADHTTKTRMLEMQRTRRRSIERVCGVCKTVVLAFHKKVCPTCLAVKRTTDKRYDKAVYKSRLRKATPLWANRFFLREAYSLSRLRTKVTGVEWHVDHIVPIRGENVCGLHVENNLRVILGVVNMKKSNHYSLEHEGRK